MAKTNTRVSVIIVTFNNEDTIFDCIDSLKKQSIPLEVFIVDNKSHDKTPKILQEEAKRWSALTPVLNIENVGFVKANNQVLPMCKGEYVLYLNPDTIVQLNALEKLASHLDSHPRVGIVGPRLIYEDGSFQISSGPIHGVLYTALWHLFLHRFLKVFIENKSYNRRVNQEKDVGWILGACLMIRRELLLKFRGFDEHFFLSIMDAVDLSKRTLEEGYRVVYYPESKVIHHGGRSWRQERALTIRHTFLGFVYYYRKHHGTFAAFLAGLLFFIAFYIRAFAAGFMILIKPREYLPVFKVYMTTLPKLFFQVILGKVK